jgi:hypothetical protein
METGKTYQGIEPVEGRENGLEERERSSSGGRKWRELF